MVIYGILGALLVGIGATLFVASNWQEMSRLSRTLLLLTGLVASYGIGYWLKYGRGYSVTRCQDSLAGN